MIAAAAAAWGTWSLFFRPAEARGGVDAPLEVCAERDPKGLYARARRGEIAHFTGVSAPYEAPEQPDVHLRTAVEPVEAAVAAVIAELHRRGFLRDPGTCARGLEAP